MSLLYLYTDLLFKICSISTLQLAIESGRRAEAIGETLTTMPEIGPGGATIKRGLVNPTCPASIIVAVLSHGGCHPSLSRNPVNRRRLPRRRRRRRHRCDRCRCCPHGENVGGERT